VHRKMGAHPEFWTFQ